MKILMILAWCFLALAIIGICVQIHDMKKEELAFKELENEFDDDKNF